MKEITPLLEELAKKIGTTTEYLWTALIRQAPINSVINIVEWIIMAFVTWLAWKGFKKAWKKAEKENWDEFWVICPLFVGIAFLILWIVALFSISSTITGFVNPEYWALKEILNAIGK